jgi:hypothetical protein
MPEVELGESGADDVGSGVWDMSERDESALVIGKRGRVSPNGARKFEVICAV